MSLEKKLVRNLDIIDSPVDDEVVMMDVDKGAYYGLDSVGSQIWNELAEPQCVDSLISRLMDVFDVTKEQCKEDIEPLLEQMLKNNLLVEHA